MRVHIGALIDVPVAQQAQQALLPSSTPPDGTPRPVVEHDASGFGSRVTKGNIAASVSEEGLVTISRVSDKTVLLRQTAQLLTAPRTAHDSAQPYARTGTARVAFAGLAVGEGIYGMGEHRGSDRCDNQCVNTSLPIQEWGWEVQHSQDQRILPNNGNAWVPYCELQ